jgi:hypothetical protein
LRGVIVIPSTGDAMIPFIYQLVHAVQVGFWLLAIHELVLLPKAQNAPEYQQKLDDIAVRTKYQHEHFITSSIKMPEVNMNPAIISWNSLLKDQDQDKKEESTISTQV